MQRPDLNKATARKRKVAFKEHLNIAKRMVIGCTGLTINNSNKPVTVKIRFFHFRFHCDFRGHNFYFVQSFVPTYLLANIITDAKNDYQPQDVVVPPIPPYIWGAKGNVSMQPTTTMQTGHCRSMPGLHLRRKSVRRWTRDGGRETEEPNR